MAETFAERFCREIREMVEQAAGMEVVNAIREEDRRVREMWKHMTDEEIVRWILEGE